MPLPDGTALARYLMTLGESRGDTHKALMIAERWRDTPQVKATIDLQIKAAVAPATTSDATWAGPLAEHGIAGEALQLQRGASILGALEGKFRRVPFRTHVARETGTGTGGAWVAEGASTPVAATAYDTLSQEAYKAQTIVVLSNELLQLGNPAAERTVRQTVTAGVTAYLDAQLLTNTITLVADTRPSGHHERRDGRHVHRHDRRADECGPRRPARRGHDAGAARVDHAADHGVSHRRDYRRNGGGERAALAVRHSAGALRQQPRANHIAGPGTDPVQRQRADRDRLHGASLPADERYAHGPRGRGDGVYVALAEQPVGGQGHALGRLPARANGQRRLHDRELLMAKPPRTPPDAGLALIERYEAAVIESRMDRLDGSGLDAADVARERAAVIALAATIGERLRADYLARTQP